jgi:hypothetical protein
VLEYEGLPAVPLANVVVLAWAGNRHEGLTRAFIASPMAHGDRIYWPEDRFVELDVEAGRHPYGLPSGASPVDEPDVPPPPEFDISLIDGGVEFPESTGTDG